MLSLSCGLSEYIWSSWHILIITKSPKEYRATSYSCKQGMIFLWETVADLLWGLNLDAWSWPDHPDSCWEVRSQSSGVRRSRSGQAWRTQIGFTTLWFRLSNTPALSTPLSFLQPTLVAPWRAPYDWRLKTQANQTEPKLNQTQLDPVHRWSFETCQPPPGVDSEKHPHGGSEEGKFFQLAGFIYFSFFFFLFRAAPAAYGIFVW